METKLERDVRFLKACAAASPIAFGVVLLTAQRPHYGSPLPGATVGRKL